ncbi:toxin-antitoxin (TA) system antitoxin [candidate division KSB3 bacterium]|nr:toxin-antitoxin (TA) system antitoxin [candidate division KSB3 bacterium]
MMTKTIDVQEVQISLEDLLSLIRQGTGIILTDASRPLARLIPLAPPPGSRIVGLHQGAIWTRDDFDDPLPDEFWTGDA